MERKIIKIIGDRIFYTYLWLVGLWIVCAFCFQMFFVYLLFSGQEERAHDISNKITWKIDGRFKNNPDNIWYEKK